MSKLFRHAVLFAITCLFSTTAIADVFFDTYQRGLAAFKVKGYADARSEFLRAYDLRHEPVILFNVAQTYRLEFNSEQALVYYKRFLAESKIAHELRKDAQAYVAALEAEQATREAQATFDADDGPKERDGAPVKMVSPPMESRSAGSSVIFSADVANNSADTGTRRSDAGHGLVPQSDPHQPTTVVAPMLAQPSASARTSNGIAPVVVGAGALALLGGGLGFELRADSRYAAAKSEMASEPLRDSLYDSANANRHLAQALAVGGLAAGGAAVWLYLRHGARERGAIADATMHVVPTATGLGISGQF